MICGNFRADDYNYDYDITLENVTRSRYMSAGALDTYYVDCGTSCGDRNHRRAGRGSPTYR